MMSFACRGEKKKKTTNRQELNDVLVHHLLVRVCNCITQSREAGVFLMVHSYLQKIYRAVKLNINLKRRSKICTQFDIKTGNADG